MKIWKKMWVGVFFRTQCSISKQDCYARALAIIGHLPRFLILNELNTKKFSHFSDCVEKLDIKCGGGGAEKIRRRLNRSVDDFDSTEIRLGKSAKFDGAGVYWRRQWYQILGRKKFDGSAQSQSKMSKINLTRSSARFPRDSTAFLLTYSVLRTHCNLQWSLADLLFTLYT